MTVNRSVSFSSVVQTITDKDNGTCVKGEEKLKDTFKKALSIEAKEKISGEIVLIQQSQIELLDEMNQMNDGTEKEECLVEMSKLGTRIDALKKQL